MKERKNRGGRGWGQSTEKKKINNTQENTAAHNNFHKVLTWINTQYRTIQCERILPIRAFMGLLELRFCVLRGTFNFQSYERLGRCLVF